jgi:RNA polymerase sigma-70 factor (ECF subfamily)
MGVDSLSDENLVTLSQAGDARAFDHLVARWEGSIYGFLRRTLGDREEARDLCQETLVRAYLNISALRDGSKFKIWLYRIALNLCRDRRRSGQAAFWTFEEDGPEELRATSERAERSAPDRGASASGMMTELEKALGALPQEQREAILLREYQGLTSEEIGTLTGVPAATVRTRIFYGLKAVRRRLRERGLEEGEV